MKEIKKIDNYKRIRIPVEFQNHLGWKVGDEIEVEIVGNDIILRKHESTPDLNLELKKPIQEEIPKEPIEFSNDGNEEDDYVEQVKEETQEPIVEDNLNKVDSIHTKLSKPPTIEEYFNLSTTKVEEPKLDKKVVRISLDLLDKKDELNDRLCPKCRKPIGTSRFKLNHMYICRDCRNRFRDKLCFEIMSKREKLV